METDEGCLTDEHEGALHCEAAELPEVCQRTIDAYYQHDYAPLFVALEPDVVFIGAGPDISHGKAELARMQSAGAAMPTFIMRDARFSLVEVIPSPTGDRAIVEGFYKLYSRGDKPMLMAVNQRITVIFRLHAELCGWQLSYVHSSNEWSELVEDEVFPVRMSRMTYDYLWRVIEAMGETGPSRKIVRVGRKGDLRFVESDGIMWAESHGKSCTVHLATGDALEVPCMLGDLQEQLPEDGRFVRIHRSYLVGLNYATKLKGAKLLLNDGTELPISTAHRDAVKEALQGR